MTEPHAPSHTATPHWFGPPDRPLLGWLSLPEAGVGESGVLILPPIGYPYWSSHRTLRVLAERLAVAGHTALRFDYDGTGDSAGDQWDGERVPAWRASVAAAAAALRDLGCARLVLAGARLGGTFALLDGAALAAEAVVAWAPVVSGRRYVKEIRLLAAEVPDGASDAPEGTLVAAGCVYRPDTLADLTALTLDDLATAPAPRALILGGAGDQGDPPLSARLRTLGGVVDERHFDDATQALEGPTEYATAPSDLITAIIDWIGPGAPRHTSRPIPTPRTLTGATTQLPAGGAPAAKALQEEVITLGPHRLVGVRTQLQVTTQPQADESGKAAVVFLNTGSEPHIGPGRAWVEYARALAADGSLCLRVDFRGWGESPDDGFAPGRPYDAHCIEDAADIVRALRANGHQQVVLVGLCASAWVALRMVLDEAVDAVIALNPQLYWQPGDPVEATMAETRLRRTSERERDARGARCGLWSTLDRLGNRPWAARWLDELAATGVPITLAFAEGDDGIDYLRNRLARRLTDARRRGTITIVELSEIDHSMGRAWLRPRVIELIRQRLDEVVSADSGRSP